MPDGKKKLNRFERGLLNLIQSDFPLESRPYAVLGRELGIDEDAAFALARALRNKGLIRRIGANFQSSSLGYSSTLCAAKVPPEKLESFIGAVNAIPGVTHNYLRDHAYNVWFTLIATSKQAVAGTLRELEEKTGLTVLSLPAERLYKIKVDFRLDD
ncbi:MAG: Lrp/AsnC family transcriptional regulator [Deltaproteobacteria bacterium]|jgi:DNA-binding Lrp family transcriptional regulator|nr:Lrp/AsnC family transcriptional regulator [Deltaproteobacteria bacterium]